MTPEALMRSVTKAFAKGDLQPLLAIINDKTVWKSASLFGDGFRFGGQYEKRAGVVEVTSLIATTYHFRHFEPREITASGEVVWGLFDAEAEFQPTGKILRMDIALRWRVRDGMLLEHQGFFDTAALLAQQATKP